LMEELGTGKISYVVNLGTAFYVQYFFENFQ